MATEALMTASGVARRHRIARAAFLVLALLFAFSILAQVSLAGLSLFVNPRWWMPHGKFGHLFGLVLLPPMFLLTYIGGMPRRARWLTFAAFILFLAQGATAAASGVPAAMHPVNALILFAVSGTIVRAAREELRRA